MKYYIIAGEASGDLHGSNLLKALKVKDVNANFRFWGGDRMQAIAGEPAKHIKDLAFMGFVEVISNLGTIFRNISFCKKDILKYQPDALILIDFPGFNLRIADFAKKNGIPVHYYVSPQIWAWKQNRVHKIKRIIDEMYCILPFEQDFYKKFNHPVHYVGHPLVDAIKNFQENAISKEDFQEKHKLSGKPILALLPGSRKQEIKTKLPIMLTAARKFGTYEILVAGAPNMEDSFYQSIAADNLLKIIPNQTYDLLNHSNIAMVTSGTATLETALFKVPQVVCYKGNPISVAIARKLIKVDYISLVNLIMNEQIVTELIQQELTPSNIQNDLEQLENDNSPQRVKMLAAYDQLEKLLGGGGASEKVASLIVDLLHKKG